jgi:hypothetical protein
MENYILVVNDCRNINNKIITAYDMTQRRLSQKQWPLYKNTPHQNTMKKGDNVIIYLAGTSKLSQHFVAYASVHSISVPNNYQADGLDTINNPPAKIIIFQKIIILKESISIKDLLDDLEFLPKKTKKWGVVLQRGAKHISSIDANTIIK